MPALTLPTIDPEAGDNAENLVAHDGPESPTSPPFSPITPVMSSTLPSNEAQGYHHGAPPAQVPPIPPLEPFSESDNPDAIALRSALSILQIQRQQALQDLKTLEHQKKVAADDPEGFSKAAAAGKIRTQSSGVLGSEPGFSPSPLQAPGVSQDEDLTKNTTNSNASAGIKYGNVPGPQNVVRCPPINWAKYHVMGEPLDKLHEEKRRRPISDYSDADNPHTGGEHRIAAPYNPWKDNLEPAATVTRTS
ncbi:MAG: hypothetical protein L6R41_003291 [Letrouitia leprolyta]|nr:MAG: hypothetical protein L6R41_003291 [Letrouitia leprolyta]